MKKIHSLLRRQLKRYLHNPTEITLELQNFINAVNEAYWEAEEDRARLNRSLELSSQEMSEQYQAVVGQLIQKEKMSSLGQLVAGVAHEINEPITFIYGNIPYVQQYTQSLIELVYLYRQYHAEVVSKILTEINSPEINAKEAAIDVEFLLADLVNLLGSMKLGADRIQKIVLSLSNFSHSGKSALKKVDIREGIENALTLLQYHFHHSNGESLIEIVREYDSLPLVECYVSELNQVFISIINNAVDSLESRYGNNSLDFSEGDNSLTKQKQIKPRILQQYQPRQIVITTLLLTNQEVEIRIKDNGRGVPQEIAGRLFDPFFTTKPLGEGTGLGLAISYQTIVEKHRGSLQCFSVPGEGAEFVIKIPLYQIKSS